MDALKKQLSQMKAKLKPVVKKKDKLDSTTELYIGNLHHNSRHHNNRHCWTMFVSTSPTDVVRPNNIAYVTYYLHSTFHPSTVTITEPPFYLPRRGWGYFEVKADIALKSFNYGASSTNDDNKDNDNGHTGGLPKFQSGIVKMIHSKYKKKQSKSLFCGKLKIIRASHSIHFGSPLVTHHVVTDLPYIVDTSELQKAVQNQTDEQAKNRLKKRRRNLLAKQNKLIKKLQNPDNDDDDSDDNAADDDDDDIDLITKQYIPEIVFSGFTLTKKVMFGELKKVLGSIMPNEVIDVIVGFSTISSLNQDINVNNDLSCCRVILENCYALKFVIYYPILELVIKNCGGCEIQTTNVNRCTRMYNSSLINLYNKGDCTSYRFERCSQCKIQGLDVYKRIIFLSFYSDNLSFQVFNAYYPSTKSKCVASFPHDDDDNDDDADDKKVSVVADDQINDKTDKSKHTAAQIIKETQQWIKSNSTDEVFVTIFRKDRDTAAFSYKQILSVAKGTSLIPFIGDL